MRHTPAFIAAVSCAALLSACAPGTRPVAAVAPIAQPPAPIETPATSPEPTPTLQATPLGGETPAPGAGAVPSTGGVTMGPTSHGPLSGKVIVVDPGHNAHFKGSINMKGVKVFGAHTQYCQAAGGTGLDKKTTEHELAWDIAARLIPQLRSEGATVVLTRPDDDGTGPCNDERAEMANRVHADFLLSIHTDGMDNNKLRGFSALTPKHSAGGDQLIAADQAAATVMLNAMKDHTSIPLSNYIGTKGTATKQEDLSVLNNLSQSRGLLIEAANLSQTDDWAVISTGEGRQGLADGMNAGLLTLLAS